MKIIVTVILALFTLVAKSQSSRYSIFEHKNIDIDVANIGLNKIVDDPQVKNLQLFAVQSLQVKSVGIIEKNTLSKLNEWLALDKIQSEKNEPFYRDCKFILLKITTNNADKAYLIGKEINVENPRVNVKLLTTDFPNLYFEKDYHYTCNDANVKKWLLSLYTD
jgi:hypothetical protein